jgi:hypothetical protein
LTRSAKIDGIVALGVNLPMGSTGGGEQAGPRFTLTRGRQFLKPIGPWVQRFMPRSQEGPSLALSGPSLVQKSQWYCLYLSRRAVRKQTKKKAGCSVTVQWVRGLAPGLGGVVQKGPGTTTDRFPFYYHLLVSGPEGRSRLSGPFAKRPAVQRSAPADRRNKSAPALRLVLKACRPGFPLALAL